MGIFAPPGKTRILSSPGKGRGCRGVVQAKASGNMMQQHNNNCCLAFIFKPFMSLNGAIISS